MRGTIQVRRDQVASSLFESEPANWTTRAACVNENPEIFYPFPNQPKLVARAKAVCAGCEVRAECLKEGRRERYGVWGGLTEWERHPHITNERKMARICEQCNELYMPTGSDQRFCSRNCLNTYLKQNSKVECGQSHSARRHRRLGEPVDELCRMAESLYRSRRRNWGQP